MNEEKYIKGFNNGYILASHKPELLQTVTENLLPANDYVAGLLDGKGQQEDERFKENIQDIETARRNSRIEGRSID